MDDILIIGTNFEEILKVKGYLSRNFCIKDFGEADKILGMKMYTTSKRGTLSLSHALRRCQRILIML